MLPLPRVALAYSDNLCRVLLGGCTLSGLKVLFRLPLRMFPPKFTMNTHFDRKQTKAYKRFFNISDIWQLKRVYSFECPSNTHAKLRFAAAAAGCLLVITTDWQPERSVARTCCSVDKKVPKILQSIFIRFDSWEIRVSLIN